MDRREAVRWMLSAAASAALADHDAFAQALGPSGPAKGYGLDPDLLKTYAPGDLWPLVLNRTQLRTAAVLCDVIIPHEGGTPSASALGVHDFINEWVSAPYATHARDRETIIDGLAWMVEEATRRFSVKFVRLSL